MRKSVWLQQEERTESNLGNREINSELEQSPRGRRGQDWDYTHGNREKQDSRKGYIGKDTHRAW